MAGETKLDLSNLPESFCTTFPGFKFEETCEFTHKESCVTGKCEAGIMSDVVNICGFRTPDGYALEIRPNSGAESALYNGSGIIRFFYNGKWTMQTTVVDKLYNNARQSFTYREWKTCEPAAIANTMIGLFACIASGKSVILDPAIQGLAKMIGESLSASAQSIIASTTPYGQADCSKDKKVSTMDKFLEGMGEAALAR